MHCACSSRSAAAARAAGRYGRRTLPLHDRLQRFLFRDRHPVAWIRHGLLHRRRAGAEPGRGDRRMGTVGVRWCAACGSCCPASCWRCSSSSSSSYRSDGPVDFTDQRHRPPAAGKRSSLYRVIGIGGPELARREHSAARHCRSGALLLAGSGCRSRCCRSPAAWSSSRPHCRARGRAAQRGSSRAADDHSPAALRSSSWP